MSYEKDFAAALASIRLEKPISDEDLVYALPLERAWGMTDSKHDEYEYHQLRLRRFLEEPRLVDKPSIVAILERKREELAKGGFDFAARDDIFEAVKVDFVHTTARYEGNPMTLSEVSLVIEQDEVIPKASFRSHLEVHDIAQAFDAMVESAKSGEEISMPLILKLHSIAAANLPECDAGELRWDQVYITNSKILPPPAKAVGPLLDALIAWYLEKPCLERACGFHLVFEDIHPFQDGNGRIGRILLNHQLLGLGYPVTPLKCDGNSTRRYYDAIRCFTESKPDRRVDGFLNVVADAIDDAMYRPLQRICADGRRSGRPSPIDSSRLDARLPVPRRNQNGQTSCGSSIRRSTR